MEARLATRGPSTSPLATSVAAQFQLMPRRSFLTPSRIAVTCIPRRFWRIEKAEDYLLDLPERVRMLVAQCDCPEMLVHLLRERLFVHPSRSDDVDEDGCQRAPEHRDSSLVPMCMWDARSQRVGGAFAAWPTGGGGEAGVNQARFDGRDKAAREITCPGGVVHQLYKPL